MLFKDINIRLPLALVLWCDNISALALASNPIYHARTKHIEVDYHFIREKVLNRDIILKFISTHDQVADVFTKGLSSPRFLELKGKLMVVPPPITLRGAVTVCNPPHDHAEVNPVNAAEGITLDDQAAANGGNPGNAAEVIADSKSSTYGNLAIFGKSAHRDSNLDSKYTINRKLDSKHIPKIFQSLSSSIMNVGSEMNNYFVNLYLQYDHWKLNYSF